MPIAGRAMRSFGPRMSSLARLRAAALLVAVGAAAQPAAGRAATIWDGVFTAEQVLRGQLAYTGPCDRCHGYKLDGAPDDPVMLPAPPVAGAKFLRKWSGRSLAILFEYTRATMPANNPGYLADAEIVDIVAFMLASSGAPAGDSELRADPQSLATFVIGPQRADASSAAQRVVQPIRRGGQVLLVEPRPPRAIYWRRRTFGESRGSCYVSDARELHGRLQARRRSLRRAHEKTLVVGKSRSQGRI
jgi:mono/diheme cytochrome c family protein